MRKMHEVYNQYSTRECMKSLEDIDLNLLLLLDWLLREKNVTRAAERIGVTQSAASRSLQRLREAFGDELLVRTGREYTLSKFASSLQPDLASAIAKLRLVARKNEVFDPGVSNSSFIIACSDYLASLSIHAWQAAVYPEAPEMMVNWRPLEPEVSGLLASGRVDIVFAPYAAMPSIPKSAIVEDMVIRPVLTDRFVLFSSASHPLARTRSITLKKFAEARHVLVSPQGTGDGIVDRQLRALGLKRRIVQRVWSFSLAAEIALSTEAVVVLPERFASLYPAGRTRSLPFKLEPLTSFVAWHASRTNDPAHSWVRRRLCQGFAP